MHTLGIDLASQDAKTAACVIAWGEGKATVGTPELEVDDDRAVALITACDWTGIDAPFGWPDAAVAAVSAHHRGELWQDAAPRDLRFRVTDLVVHDKAHIWPLSVSSDRIAVPTWRCARILSRLPTPNGGDRRRAVDRTGADQIVEVYPAAALRLWGLDKKGYKSSGNAQQKAKAYEKRVALVAQLQAECGDWLQLDDGTRQKCEDNDDALDALVASLVARAAANRQTDPPSEEEAQVAAREGWIHLPQPGSLPQLAHA